MSRLGLGRYDVFLADRGGLTRIGKLSGITRLNWERVRDDISSARLRIEVPGPDCAALLKDAHTVRNELVILRNEKIVWQGPITLIEFGRSYVEVEAHDVLWYASRRALNTHLDYSSANPSAPVGGTNTIDVINDLLSDIFTVADAEGYRVELFPVYGSSDPKTKADFKAYSRGVWEVLDQYADNGGIDYVVAGRRVIWFDTHLAAMQLPRLGDEDFKDALVVTEYGSQLETRRFLTDGKGLMTYAQATAEWLAYYGPIETVLTSAEEDQTGSTGSTGPLLESLTADISRNYPSPVLVRVPDNTALSPAAPVDINDLIPGAYLPIFSTLTIRTVEQWQKLDSLHVVVEDGEESVQVVLSPAPSHFELPVGPT